MQVKNAYLEKLEKDKPNGKCRKWRMWVICVEKRCSKVFNGTYTDASNALERYKNEIADKVPDSETFAAYAASWLLWREKSGDFAPGTIENNKREIAALNRSDLSGMEIAEITPESCRNALMWVKSHPAQKQGELSNTTMNKIYQTLNAIMAQAFDDERIRRNPMSKVKPPKPDTKEKEALTPDELMLFVNRLNDLQLDGRVMALYFMALLGLRRGEACAIYDADVVGNVAHVQRAIKERNGKIDMPKSNASIRKLPMPPQLVEKVWEWRTLRKELGWRESKTLCCNTQGGILRPQLLQRWWDKVKPTIGCDGMTLHQLRHSNLSMMARHMSVFDLQRYAGWSSIEPAKIYIHDDFESIMNGVNDAWQLTTK